ncbi:MAG: DUF475 domain-containing protein [Paracoccaceae bacterium]|nr:DUF475 domain-containing protein [Paracoccaceae bacterium]
MSEASAVASGACLPGGEALVSTTFAYFRVAFGVTLAGLALAFWLGTLHGGGLGDGFAALIIGAALAVLEVSISFDNAIVNANTLNTMSLVWRRRFLTWGIVIAVFGMRILFPLVVVGIAANLGPWDALRLATQNPLGYEAALEGARVPIAAFGGTFLMMVALGYFVNEHKEIHWFDRLECKLKACGSLRGLESAMVLVVILGFASMLPNAVADGFMIASIAGLLTFTVVKLLGRALDSHGLSSGGLGAFLYLELLDASFSFDGVIGAFAMTQNIFLIAIGLGIGAMFVRSMTVMLVDRGTLTEFRYLEHGAFYSILALSVIMFIQTQVEVSELVTGAFGVGLIGASLWASIRYNRRTDAM